MKAYPVSVRMAILDAVDAGMNNGEAARVFGVGLATIKRYVRLRRETGSLTPKRPPGRSPLIRVEEHAALQTLVHGVPGTPLRVYCRLWQEEGGIPVSSSTLSRTLGLLGFTRLSGAR